MKDNYFLSLFKESSKSFFNNPILILPSLILLLLSYALSYLFILTEYYFPSLAPYFPSIYLLVFLFLGSPILAVLISLSLDSLKRKSKASIGKSLSSFKLWIPNFTILLITAIAFYFILIISNAIAVYTGKFFQLNISNAQIIFFIIYFIGLLFILFLTYPSFILVSKNQGITNSLKQGISFAKKEYLLTLSVILIFFISNQIINYLSFIHSIIPTLINVIFLFPYLILILTKIIQDKQ